MPLRETKIYCINHSEEEMQVIDDGMKDVFHISILAKKREPDSVYAGTNRATAYNLYSCKICGYCELYLTSFERDILLDKIKGS